MIVGNTYVKNTADCPAPSSKSKLLLVGDFETGNFNQFSKWESQTCCNYSLSVVSSPVRSGSYAMRSEMRMGDYYTINQGHKKYRTELSERPRLPADIERWYGFSVYLPQGYKTDRGRDVVVQAHGPGNTGQQWEIHTTGGKWRSLMYSGPFEKYKAMDDLGPFQTGRWTDFVVHAKYAHQSGGIYESGKMESKLPAVPAPLDRVPQIRYISSLVSIFPGGARAGQKTHHASYIMMKFASRTVQMVTRWLLHSVRAEAANNL